MGGDRINDVESQNSSDASDEDDRQTLEYLPNQTQILSSFQSSAAMQMLEPSHPKHEDFTEFLLALAICHHATTQKSQQTQA